MTTLNIVLYMVVVRIFVAVKKAQKEQFYSIGDTFLILHIIYLSSIAGSSVSLVSSVLLI